jgi:hypothetical protein
MSDISNNGMSDIALILAEMKAQRDDDRSCRKRDDNRARQRPKLKEQARIMAIIAAITKRFRPDEILKFDGSNLRQWERMIRLHVAERFGDLEFYLGESTAVLEPSEKAIARGILHSSISSNLTYNILDIPSVFDVYEHLLGNFWMINRTAQLQTWNNFLAIKPAAHSTTPSIFESLRYAGKAFQ